MKWKIAFFASVSLCMFHALWGFLRLPPIIATHFGLTGEPDATGSKAVFLVLYIVIVSIVQFILLIASAVVTRKPEYINMPNKEYWLAGEFRLATVASVLNLLWQIGILTNILFAAICQVWVEANMSNHSFNKTAPMIAVIIYVGISLGLGLKFYLKFRRKNHI